MYVELHAARAFRFLFQHLGYAAILVIVLLGNAGVPAPEAAVLVLGGYLAWHGRLRLPLVILVGVVSASLGDSIKRLRRAAGIKGGREAVRRDPGVGGRGLHRDRVGPPPPSRSARPSG